MRSGVYKITNTETARFYIGSSNDIDGRWIAHKRDLNAGNHINLKLQHSWDFYGEDKFTIEMVEEVLPNEKLLLEREQHYLDLFKPYHRTIGYNICSTACGGDNFTHNPRKEEIRQKMVEICSGEGNPMFGKKHKKSSIDEQKKKAVGRYTLEWFVEKYGKKEGKRKYEKRRKMLICRDNLSWYNPKTSKLPTFTGRKHSKDLEVKRKHSREYFRNHWDEFVKLVKSNKYSHYQLSSKLGISRNTIRQKIKKIDK